MNKVELSKVLDLLIAEDKEEASKQLHEWFVGKSKTILEELMQEDDDALDSIKDDQDEIESEEFYGDADLSEAGEDEVEGDEEVVDGDVDAEFAGDDMDMGDDVEGAADDLGAEMGAEEEVPVEDKVDDLEAQLAALKAEFDSLMGAEAGDDLGDVDLDADASDEFAGDDMGMDADVEESVFESEDEELDESEELDEEDEFQDLEESFELEKVSEPDMSEGSEAGNGGKQNVTKDSPIPQRKTGDRVGGAVVEIKGKTHKGYEREAAPAVNTKPILKNQVSNAKADLVGVSPEGDKKALINKGPTPDKGKSPIGGGAVDLRGDDMKRKK